MAKTQKKLGEILVEWGFVQPKEVEKALAHAKAKGLRIGEALLDLKLCTDNHVYKALAQQFGMEYIDLDKNSVPPGAVNLIPDELMKKHLILPLGKDNGKLRIAIHDPVDLELLDILRFRLNADIRTVLAPKSRIKSYIDELFNTSAQNTIDKTLDKTIDRFKTSMDQSLDKSLDRSIDKSIDLGGMDEATANDPTQAPMIKLVQAMIAEAVRNRASDIHIEPMKDRIRVRYRIDGECVERDRIPLRMKGPLISRLKIMAGVDIAEKRLPQDGRIKLTVDKTNIDFRVSTLPAYYGESVVLRILRPDSVRIGIQNLGFEEDDYRKFQKIIKRPNGIFLVTGPTGSGKTNANTVREWSDRARPTRFSRTGARGVPLEEIVALANVTGRNVWVNVPLHASDDYVTHFAALLRDTLHPDAIVHVEYSNEVWNFGFEQAKDNLTAAKANPNLTKPDDFGRCAQQAADRLGGVSRIFKTVFGDAAFAARVRPVVGGFVANTYWAQNQLDWLKDHHPGLIKELAIAPYFGVEGDIKDVDKPGATAEALFAKLNALIDGQLNNWIADHAALAKSHGVTLVAYEGGVHLTATNGVNEDLKRQMQADPRIAETYRHLLDVWHRHGGGLFTQFGHIGPYTKFGYWGLLESMDQPGSVKWDFIMSLLLPPGDANLDGKADVADFQILRENLGQSDRWREQGDFNADRKVDTKDLQIFRDNARDLTPEQTAAVQKALAPARP